MSAKKHAAKSWSAIVLVAALLASLLVFPAAAAQESLTFTNTSGGKNMISLTEEQDYKAVLVLDTPVSADTVTWTLFRNKGAQDENIFPYQYLGGSLADWTKFNSDEALFTEITTVEMNDGGKSALALSFSSGYFLGSGRADSPRGNRNAVLDYTGDFTLACLSADGKVLGETTVRITPYDDYNTNSEIAASLVEAVAAAQGVNGLYVELNNLGKSTQGYDIPYVVISDSKTSVDNYLALTEQALKDPAAVLKQIEAGKVDYRIPVLFSNIHPDETPGADAPLNLIWDVINSFEHGGKISYKILTGFTAEGEAQLKSEMEAEGIHWSDLVEKYVTGLGFIKGGNTSSGQVDLEKYYTIEEVTLDVKELLDHVILLVCPTENVDGRTSNIRQNGNGFDINRDNMFQTQVETQLMTSLIAKWNPATMVELHGFVAGFQVEPCSPPHEPNFEYDLFAENGLKSGEAFGIGAVANNSMFNSYVMPLRDYLVTDEAGNPYWEAPWDDMSTNYTPQYSMLHGTVAFTIEVPQTNQQAVKSLEYGLIHHLSYVMENKASFYQNQLTGWVRGMNNIDEPAIGDWYVDMNDNTGAEKDIYRPKYAGNNNFFPECYIIPLDAENQSNLAAAYDMQAFLLRNGVRVHELSSDVTIGGTIYKAGSMVVSMYQAKRNVANGALYNGVLITTWTDLYSEPVTAFGHMRGFDFAAIDIKGAVTDAVLTEITEAKSVVTAFSGVEGKQVIIDNNSVEAIAMANKMVADGVKVGFVTEGDYIADFVVDYASFVSYKNTFVVKAIGVETAPKAQVIKPAALYIPGFAGDFSIDANGNPYGAKNFPNYSNTNYNFDRYAYGEQMGFTITGNANAADIIVGNRALDAGALAAVKAGTPYLAAGSGTLKTIKDELLGQYGFDFVSSGTNQDALYFATYDTASLTTAGYAKRGDEIVYSYGGAYISAVPTGAAVLMTAQDKTPLEGFMMQENLDNYLGETQAISYKANGLDMVVFAGTLTNKAHQQDDYQFAANTIFAKNLGADYATGFTDIAGHWGYDAVAYALENKLFNGTSATTFAPDVTMSRSMMVTVLHNLSGETATAESAFTDVSADAWYANGVAWAAEKGIANGTGNGQFSPDAPLTREQAATMLHNYAVYVSESAETVGDLAQFPDGGSVSEWAKSAMGYMVGEGLLSGTGNGSLAPQGVASRVQIATILQRYLTK